jgi:hypothetical protein
MADAVTFAELTRAQKIAGQSSVGTASAHREIRRTQPFQAA